MNLFQVDEQSTAYGGELVADVLKVDKGLRFSSYNDKIYSILRLMEFPIYFVYPVVIYHQY
jgi:hypothetical protein